MDWVKVREALDCCEQKINGTWWVTGGDYLRHCLKMIQQMRSWPEDDIGKAFRWLGYIQGVMHAFNVSTLNELNDMSRLTEADKARVATSWHACSGGCGKQNLVPWRCAECVEGGAILNRNAIKLAREEVTRLRRLIETATKAGMSSHVRTHSKALFDLSKAYCEEQPATTKCVCYTIIGSDRTRHFKECPERENFPHASTDPCFVCNGSGRGPAGLEIEDQVMHVEQRCDDLRREMGGPSRVEVKRWPDSAVDLRANVMAFHKEVVGGEMPSSPQVPVDSIARRRVRLIAEEFFETVRAVFRPVDANTRLLLDEQTQDMIKTAERALEAVIDVAPINVDLVAFADGLADLMYVCEGGFIGFGIDSRPIHAEVQRSNMAKKGGEMRGDGKRLKPSGWTPPDLASIIRQQQEGS